MANVDRPHGLKPVRMISGVAYNGSVRRYKKEASVILAPGDPVVLTGSAEAATGIPLITRAQGTEGTPTTITGVVVAIDPIRGDLSKKHMAAADTGYVLVADNADLLFEIQEDGAGDPIDVNDVGEGCDILVGDANTTIGLSVVELDSSNAGTGDQVQIMEFVQREDNEVDSANAKIIVRINEHTYRGVGTMI